MTSLSLNSRVDQAWSKLTKILQETSEQSPELHDQVAAEIDALASRLDGLLSASASGGASMKEDGGQPGGERTAAAAFSENSAVVERVLQGAKAGLYFLDMRKNQSLWSPELYDLVGLPRDERASTDLFTAMIHPEDRPAVMENRREAVQRGGSFYQEFRLVRPDGETIWLSSIGFVELDTTGTPLFLTGVNQDITARKNAEDALRKSEAALRKSEAQARQRLAEIETIYQNAPMGLCVFDRQLRWVRLNQRLAEINGVPLEDHIGKTPKDIVPDVGEQAEAALRNILETGQPLLDFEMNGTTAAQPGVQRYWNERWTPIKDDQGTIIGISVAAEEITERKRAEDALRNSEEMFSKAFRSSPVAMAITRAADGEYIDVNDTHTAVLGYTREELIGHTTLEMQTITDPQERAEVLRLLKEHGSVRNREIKSRTKSGEERILLISLEPFEREGEACILGAVIDVTERKRAEAALQKTSEELNERNNALVQAHNDLMNERNRLVAVMEALPVGLAICDEKGGVLEANPEYETVWGNPRPQASDVDDYDVYKAWWVETGERVQPEEWAAARAVQKGETVTGQYFQIQRFDGTTGYVLNSGAPVRDSHGKIIGGVVAIMDITSRVEVEKALQESKDRFRVALASVPLLVYTCDRDLRYTWVYNPQLGLTSENLLGKRDDELLPADTAANIIAAKQKALDTGQGGVHEIKLAVDGVDSYYILTTDPIKDSRGVVTGLTCSAIDISQQKHLALKQKKNEMRMETQRRLMEQREQERQGIARDIHDGPIQTLAGTSFNVQILKEAYPDPALVMELNQIGLNVKSAIRELRDVVNDLRPPSIIRFGITRAIQMHVEDLRERYPEIKIALDLAEDKVKISEQVSLAIFRMFQEGMNNIIRHAEASLVWVSYHCEAGEFILELRDNGKGFEVQQDISVLTGSGHFGLAGMKERVEIIGGELQVCSQPGHGTTVTARGPLYEIE